MALLVKSVAGDKRVARKGREFNRAKALWFATLQAWRAEYLSIQDNYKANTGKMEQYGLLYTGELTGSKNCSCGQAMFWDCGDLRESGKSCEKTEQWMNCATLAQATQQLLATPPAIFFASILK